MGVAEEGGKVATATVESLKSQPLALALVVVNVLFLLGGGYILHDIAQNLKGQQERKDMLLADLARRCITASPQKQE
ncbi:hypothetical protein AAFX91_14070 [Bradyrhizobium sp. 31Argb]|uniref:hypothetical protein n=1 Tax=unclassified Bradyrhizobium TaxID=2631580 RepID=UPI00102E84A7|nr:hypothetical protein [Bradyrhizobium sp. Leo170]TAI63881.1 hypothetical protein CWO89_21855 [Bradyrhizobium sp. Leo170]